MPLVISNVWPVEEVINKDRRRLKDILLIVWDLITRIAVRLSCRELCWVLVGVTEIFGEVGFIFCTDDTTFSEKRKKITSLLLGPINWACQFWRRSSIK